MFRRFIAGATFAAALLAQNASPPKAGPSALNKPAIEAYLRHVLMWPESVKMTLGDPAPAPMPGYYKIRVLGTSGDRSQEQIFYVSADSQIVIHGDVFDVQKNPFQADMDLMKTDDEPSLGIPGAPVTVVEFADFQCPYCKQESGVLRSQLTQAYPKDVQLFFIDYPLESSHPFARGAAILGRCIYRQSNDSFWAYHDWIYGHQGEIKPDNLRDKVFEYAKGDKNLDMAKLTACAVSPEARQEVDRSESVGDSLRISATPTIFVNGRRMVGTVPLADLKMVVDHEIAYAATAKKDADCCSVQIALPGTASATGGGAKK